MGSINYYPNIVTGKDAVRSLSEIICSDDLERDDGERTVSSLNGAVEFEHVGYHYPGEEKKVVEKGDMVYAVADIPHGCVCIEKGIVLDTFTPCREDFIK